MYGRVSATLISDSVQPVCEDLALMNVMQMEKGKARWSMIADDIWDMILGKAGRLPGPLAPEIIEKAKAKDANSSKATHRTTILTRSTSIAS